MLVVILGPTGSGKTALSVALGRRFDGEIVSCDSVAVYRGLEIGSAKPSAEQRELVPHHLLDVVAPDELYTAGTMPAGARAAHRRHRRPGQAAHRYRRHWPLPSRFAARLVSRSAAVSRHCVSACSAERKREEQAHCTGFSSASIQLLPLASTPNDLSKVIRAIEVTMAASRPMSEAWKEGRQGLAGYRLLRLGLDPGRAATLCAHQ